MASIVFLPATTQSYCASQVSEQHHQPAPPFFSPSAFSSSAAFASSTSIPLLSHTLSSHSIAFSTAIHFSARIDLQKRVFFAETVAFAAESSAPMGEQYEEYEVELEKPIGIKFYKGADGGTYVDAMAPGGNAARTGLFQPGDKVLATSAVFGNEMWPAAEYGRTSYTIRQRVGSITLKMQKRYGKREDAAVSAEKVAAQRNANIVGDAVREIQMQNYLRKMEMKKQREMELNEGLKLYRSGKYEAALEKFESILGLKPEAREEAVASYNVACCCSKLNQIEAGLSALEEAMEAGFDDFKAIRTDPDLQKLRESENFIPLVEKFDESFINENVVRAFKNVFGLFGKK